jgi:cellulose synthase/poly-beta-1,6-N-acetylglucosamine synthase-like glycosyltransferase
VDNDVYVNMNNKNKKYIVNDFNIMYLMKILSLLILFILLNILINNNKNNLSNYEMKIYKKYIIHCKRLKKYSKSTKKNSGLPYLSIILPAFNMEEYIERALSSILNQSFQDFEIIIVNDFSKDKTKQIY